MKTNEEIKQELEATEEALSKAYELEEMISNIGYKFDTKIYATWEGVHDTANRLSRRIDNLKEALATEIVEDKEYLLHRN